MPLQINIYNELTQLTLGDNISFPQLFADIYLFSFIKLSYCFQKCTRPNLAAHINMKNVCTIEQRIIIRLLFLISFAFGMTLWNNG